MYFQIIVPNTDKLYYRFKSNFIVTGNYFILKITRCICQLILQFTWEKCTNEGITWQIITNSTSIVIMLLCNLCSISFNWYYMKWVFSPIINLTLEPVIKSEVSSFASVAYDADVLENYEFGKSALFIFEIDSKSVGTIEDYTSQIDGKNWTTSER